VTHYLLALSLRAPIYRGVAIPPGAGISKSAYRAAEVDSGCCGSSPSRDTTKTEQLFLQVSEDTG